MRTTVAQMQRVAARVGRPWASRPAIGTLTAIATLAAWAGGCSTPPRAPAADAIFIGSFITLDPSRPRAEAVGVSHGRIVSVGSLAEVERGASGATTRTTIPGVGLPGFADAHVHVASLGQQLERLD